MSDRSSRRRRRTDPPEHSVQETMDMVRRLGELLSESTSLTQKLLAYAERKLHGTRTK